VATQSGHENRGWARRASLIILGLIALLIVGAFNLPGGVDRIWADCGRSDWEISVPGGASIEKAADLDNCSVINRGDTPARVQGALGAPSYRGNQVWEYQVGQVDGFRDCTVAVLFARDRRVKSVDVRGCGW